MTLPDHAPLIVTALMGSADFAWADGMRRAHFPPERNHIPAHITLFHHLPPARRGEIARCLAGHCAGPPPAAQLARVLFLGRGVAYGVDSPGLLAIRDDVADRFADDLTPQDRATPRLHITVQNKVAPDAARALHTALAAAFAPRPLAIAGLAVWAYLGGPWALLDRFAFRGAGRAKGG